MEPNSSSQNMPAPIQLPNQLPAQAVFPEAGTQQPGVPAAFQVPISPPLDVRVIARLKECDPTTALVSLRTPNGRTVLQEPLMFFVFNFPAEAAEKLKQGGLVYVSIDTRDGKLPITFGMMAPPPQSQANLTPEQLQIAELREMIARQEKQREHERALAMLRPAAAPSAAGGLKEAMEIFKEVANTLKALQPAPVAPAPAADPAAQIKPIFDAAGAMFTGMANMSKQAQVLTTPVETEASKIAAYTGAAKELIPVVAPFLKPAAPPVTQPNPAAQSPFGKVA